MRDKEKRFPDLLRKKGFYVALYGAVAVMLTVAVVISYSNFGKPLETPGSLAIGNNPVTEPITQSGDAGYAVSSPKTVPTPSVNQNTEPADNVQTYVPVTPNRIGNGKDYNVLDPFEMEETYPVGNTLDKPYKEQTASEEAKTPEVAKADTGIKAEAIDPEPKVVVINAFREELKMEWPILGEIIMDYSADTGIYDVTLEHYRTNDSIAIAAEIGSEVRASAEGIVVSTGYDRVNGYFVVIEHGNGWTTTYSQLQENLLVAKDDVVSQGMIIGGVGGPSIYSTMLGSHLEFCVRKDSVAQNPNKVLTER